LTGQKGRKKLHQPARAHCVCVAGRDARLCGAEPSETPHRERPGKKISRRSRGAKRTKGTRYQFFGPTSSRVDETLALSSMWPIALATVNGRSAAACRPPVVGRGSLCRKTSSLCGRLDESTLLIPLFSAATLSGVHFLTGQKGTKKAAPTGTSSLRLRRRAVRAAAPRKARKKNPAKTGGERAGGDALFRSTSKRGSIGRRSQPATGIDTKADRRAQRPDQRAEVPVDCGSRRK
jgi:hypothetical protein